MSGGSLSDAFTRKLRLFCSDLASAPASSSGKSSRGTRYTGTVSSGCVCALMIEQIDINGSRNSNLRRCCCTGKAPIGANSTGLPVLHSVNWKTDTCSRRQYAIELTTSYRGRLFIRGISMFWHGWSVGELKSDERQAQGKQVAIRKAVNAQQSLAHRLEYEFAQCLDQELKHGARILSLGKILFLVIFSG